jgi:predicted methyltransferase
VARDAQRKPLDTLAFFGTMPGMRVAELGAGGGYTTELVARTVGPTGQVFAQNVEAWGGPEMDASWNARLAQPANKPVVRVTRGWEDPLPAEAHNLDAVYSVMVYHDVIAEKADPVRMNQAVFAALKTGGRYVIIDNTAVAGSGPEVATTLHRIDEALVRQQVEAAGFKFDASGDFLRNTADTRDWAVDRAGRTEGARRIASLLKP